MKKFPSKNRLREVKVFNPHGLASLTQQKVFIAWSPQELGRAYRSAHYSVVHVGFKSDPKAHWRDYGSKTFNIFGAVNKDETLAEAVAWSNARYGKREWVRDPWGSYQDPSALTEAWKLIKAAKPEAQ